MIFLAFSAAASFSQENQEKNYESQIAARMADDLTVLLEQIVGKGKSKTFVEVQGEFVFKQEKESNNPNEEIISLPGYAQINTLERTNKFLQNTKEQTQHSAKFQIKKVNVSIVFDKSITDARINTIRLLITDIMRLDEKRGDTIVTQKSEMVKWWQNLINSPESQRSLLLFSMSLLVLIFAGIIFYALSSRLFTSVIDYFRATQTYATPGEGGGNYPGRGAGGMGGPAEGEFAEILDVNQGPGGASAMLEHITQFEFLDKYSVSEISDIIAEEHEEDIAIIIAALTDLKPHISSKILLSLPSIKKQKVTHAMANLKEVEPERIIEIENNLRMKIEKTIKGPQKLAKLLSILNPEERQQIQDNLKGLNRELIDKIENSLITFEEICLLEDKKLRLIVMSAPYREWACALKGLSDKVANNVVKIFPEDVRIIVQDLLKGNFENSEIVNSRAKIISKTVELAGKGKVEIGKV